MELLSGGPPPGTKGKMTSWLSSLCLLALSFLIVTLYLCCFTWESVVSPQEIGCYIACWLVCLVAVQFSQIWLSASYSRSRLCFWCLPTPLQFCLTLSTCDSQLKSDSSSPRLGNSVRSAAELVERTLLTERPVAVECALVHPPLPSTSSLPLSPSLPVLHFPILLPFYWGRQQDLTTHNSWYCSDCLARWFENPVHSTLGRNCELW